MFELNETINWKPKSTGEGRFGNWIKNANDWNLSRSRFWGIHCQSGEQKTNRRVLIGSIGELYNEIEKSIQAGFQKKILLKDSKLEIWMKPTMIYLHKT
jgi:isoleucyl-tRNA synthetase